MLFACRAGLPPDQLPRFTDNGALLKPVGWEAWVMVGASTGLSYAAAAPPPAGVAPGMFHNVYVQPWAYRAFLRDGALPERTMFVLSFYEASQKSTPARAGFYEGDRLASIEVHVKQRGIDKTGWGFFGFGDSAGTASMIPGAAPCYSCHATEAAHDQVFTQFYPPLRERLARSPLAPRDSPQ
jgi:hypothetical protein